MFLQRSHESIELDFRIYCNERVPIEIQLQTSHHHRIDREYYNYRNMKFIDHKANSRRTKYNIKHVTNAADFLEILRN